METKRLGTPVNTKSLLAFIFNQMERLNSGEIDWQTANAQAKLASQANNVLDYELKRTIVEIRLKEIGGGVSSTIPKLRNIESKSFDDIEEDRFAPQEIKELR